MYWQRVKRTILARFTLFFFTQSLSRTRVVKQKKRNLMVSSTHDATRFPLSARTLSCVVSIEIVENSVATFALFPSLSHVSILSGLFFSSTISILQPLSFHPFAITSAPVPLFSPNPINTNIFWMTGFLQTLCPPS